MWQHKPSVLKYKVVKPSNGALENVPLGGNLDVGKSFMYSGIHCGSSVLGKRHKQSNVQKQRNELVKGSMSAWLKSTETIAN